MKKIKNFIVVQLQNDEQVNILKAFVIAFKILFE